MCQGSTSITKVNLQKKCQLITDGRRSSNFDHGDINNINNTNRMNSINNVNSINSSNNGNSIQRTERIDVNVYTKPTKQLQKNN